jgi:hypothetical protein
VTGSNLCECFAKPPFKLRAIRVFRDETALANKVETLAKDRKRAVPVNLGMNLVIRDNEGRVLYGHQVLKRIVATGKTIEAAYFEGIEADVFVAYVGTKFQENRYVQSLVRSGIVDRDLLEAVSDSIELTIEDAHAMRAFQD